MKKWMIPLMVLALACLFSLAVLADELPDGVEIRSLDGPAVTEEIPEEEPVPTPAMEAVPINAAPQTGDRSGTLLALSGIGFSLLALSLARRLKEQG